jgi:NADH dehydrogenase
VLGAFVPRLSERAREQLVRLGVEVRTGARVTGVDAEGVTYETRAADGAATVERLACRTVIWAAGVAASPLGAALARETGAALDRAGRIVVEPDLSLPAIPRSPSSATSPRRRATARARRRRCPASAPAPSRWAAPPRRTWCGGCRAEPTRPFRYIDYGNLAAIGRKAAVVELAVPGLGALRFSGFFAWLFWLFAHIYFLIGFRNRLMVMVDWAWAYFTYQRGARVVAEPDTGRRQRTRS